MANDLLLLSGNDIPFAKARLTIHQPTIKEIAYIGEEPFFVGCELLNFSKDVLSDEDKSHLVNNSDFEVFMSIMKDKKTTSIQKDRISAMMVLSLMFPDYRFAIDTDQLVFVKTDEDGKEQEGHIDGDNFDEFKETLVEMFCLSKTNGSDQNYNAKDKMGKQIAEKLQKARVTVAQSHGQSEKISVFSRYISILSIGLGMSFEDLMHYTVYQLFDAFERFELKSDYDFYISAKLAGAKDIEEVDHWMKEIHP